MSKSSHALRGAFSANRRLQLALAIALLLAAIGVVISLNRPATTVEYLVATRDLPSGTELQAAAFKAVPLAERAHKLVYDTRGIWLDQPAVQDLLELRKAG